MHNDLDGYDGLSYFGPGSQLQCKHSWTCNTGPPPPSYQFPTGDLNLMNFSAQALNIFVSCQLFAGERERAFQVSLSYCGSRHKLEFNKNDGLVLLRSVVGRQLLRLVWRAHVIAASHPLSPSYSSV